jgi:hypothetical protein
MVVFYFPFLSHPNDSLNFVLVTPWFHVVQIVSKERSILFRLYTTLQSLRMTPYDSNAIILSFHNTCSGVLKSSNYSIKIIDWTVMHM